jgi:hypothetical protein
MNLCTGQVAIAGGASASATAAAQPLRAHPALLDCIPEVSSGEAKYRLDHPARLLPSAQQQRGAWLNSAAVEDVKRLGYDIVVA